jgi:hypothetical protein
VRHEEHQRLRSDRRRSRQPVVTLNRGTGSRQRTGKTGYDRPPRSPSTGPGPC